VVDRDHDERDDVHGLNAVHQACLGMAFAQFADHVDRMVHLADHTEAEFLLADNDPVTYQVRRGSSLPQRNAHLDGHTIVRDGRVPSLCKDLRIAIQPRSSSTWVAHVKKFTTHGVRSV
jgi:hypothetical protein